MVCHLIVMLIVYFIYKREILNVLWRFEREDFIRLQHMRILAVRSRPVVYILTGDFRAFCSVLN
jgi:hypothetical protein